MKVTVFFLFTGLLHLSVSIYSQKPGLTINLRNVNVERVLQKIEKDNGITFLYRSDLLNDLPKVTINVNQESLENILDHILIPYGLSYEVDDHLVVIRKIPLKTVEITEAEEAPPKKELSGRVVDTSGTPVAGVSVYVKNTTTGTVTDERGNFNLFVNLDAEVLVFSFVGMTTEEIFINGTVFSIIMADATLEMAEVIVVGYGEQRRISVVGAISTASGEQLRRMNVSEVSNSLTGSVPGLITIQQTSIPGGGDINTLMAGSSGDADQGTKIYIRGQSTWNGGEPLILVDGIERRMDELDPNEISNISVLKDASATAVFGVRGANGVILFTTRRGTLGKPKLSFDAQHTTSVISKIAKPVNSYDANVFRNDAIINELALSPESWGLYKPQEILNYYKTQQYPELFPDIDWAEEMLRDASSSYKFNTNIAGGTSFVKYFGSLGYLHEGGIVKSEDLGLGYEPNFTYDRFNFRSNLDFQFTNTTRMSLNLAGNYGNTVNPGYNDSPIRRMRGIYSMPPDIFPVRYSDGTFASYEGFPFPNPYVAMNLSGIDRVTQGQVFTDVNLEQKLDRITKGLSVKGAASYDNILTENGRAIGSTDVAFKWIDPEIIYSEPEDSAAFIYWQIPSSTHGYDYVSSPFEHYPGEYQSLSRNLFYQLSLNYNRDFGEHSLSGLALMNRRESAGGSSFVSKREDWVSRVTYNYNLRYFLELNAGYNGSEKFDRKYRFGLFPSIGVGWMVSNESFFQKAFPWWSALKVRYSNGIVGSDDGIARWLYVGSWRSSNNQWRLGQPITQTGYRVSFEGAVPNPEIHWETAVKQDMGIETGFLDNTLKISFDYFTDDRRDMLISASERTTPAIIGAPLPAANLGKTETRGFEFNLEFNKYFNAGWNFATRVYLGYAKDKIIYRDDPELRPDYQKQAGFPIGQTRAGINYGVIQNWDELYSSTLYSSNSISLPGDLRMIDYNADGYIDTDDVVPFGYPNRPQYNYAFNLSMSYKGFAVFAMLYVVFNSTLDQDYLYLFQEKMTLVYPFHIKDSWSPENGVTTDAVWRGARFLASNRSHGHYKIMDGSYLRLKNIEISYDLPERAIAKLRLSNLRFYLTGYNLWTWTKEEWPEDRESPAGVAGSVINTYPMMKRFTTGISISL